MMWMMMMMMWMKIQMMLMLLMNKMIYDNDVFVVVDDDQNVNDEIVRPEDNTGKNHCLN